MRIRNLLILFLIILFTLGQSTILNSLQIFNTKPDILLILIIFFSFYYGRGSALVVGGLCGIFSAATSGIPSGICLLSYSLTGLVLGHIGRKIYPVFSNYEETGQKKSRFYASRIYSEIGIAFIVSLLFYLFSFLVLSSGKNLFLFNAFIATILPSASYTAMLTPFLFRFLKIVFAVK